MPQVNMIDSTSFTVVSSNAASPVSGFRPMFDSVAAITARSRLVTVIAHCRKYTSSALSASPGTIPKFSSRCAIARLRCPVRRSDS